MTSSVSSGEPARAVGVIPILIGVYVTAIAIAAVTGHAAPERSLVGLALTAASVLVLPVLAPAKLLEPVSRPRCGLAIAAPWRTTSMSSTVNPDDRFSPHREHRQHGAPMALPPANAARPTAHP